MIRLAMRFCLCFIFTPLLTGQTFTDSYVRKVRISGHVMDKAGHPVQNATVEFFPFAGFIGMRTYPLEARSDASGYFTFSIPPLGKGSLRAMKFDDGFPDAINALYGREAFNKKNGSVRRINVKEGASSIEVTLRFGDPYAVIDWTIRSGADHSPLDSSAWKIALTDEPKSYESASGLGAHFLFVLPKRPVTIVISAPGYKDWSTADDPDFGRNFILKPGTRQRRDIYLKKIK